MGGQMGGRRDGKKDDGDSPRGSVVENLPSNAKDMGSIPGQGIKILHLINLLFSFVLSYALGKLQNLYHSIACF